MSKSLLHNLENYKEGDETKLINPTAEEMRNIAYQYSSRYPRARRMSNSPDQLELGEKLNQTNVKSTYRLGNQHLNSFSNSVSKLYTGGLQGFQTSREKESNNLNKRESLTNVSEKASVVTRLRSGEKQDQKGEGLVEGKAVADPVTIEENHKEHTAEDEPSSEALSKVLDLSRGSKSSVLSELDPQWQTQQLAAVPRNESKRQPDITDYLTMLSSR